MGIGPWERMWHRRSVSLLSTGEGGNAAAAGAAAAESGRRPRPGSQV